MSTKIKEIKGGHTYVVDIYNLKDEEKTLVFGDILRTIYELYAESDVEDQDLPKKVIIFVDELNKYAPGRRGESESSILEYVLDIAARGRSLGVVLTEGLDVVKIRRRLDGQFTISVSREVNESLFGVFDDVKRRDHQFLLTVGHPAGSECGVLFVRNK